MTYRILITNDDGVNSSGLYAAYEAVKGLGEVTIVAPATQQSAVGRSMTLFEPLRISKHTTNGILAYGVSGRPTDAVLLGMFTIMDKKPDLVISGVNIGENLSTEAVTTSGTIGAALEAASQDVPAIAVSMKVEDEGDKFMDMDHMRDYSVTMSVINRLAKCVLEGAIPEGIDVLNVNVPSRAMPDTEVVVTSLARKMYNTCIHHRHDPRGRPYYWIDGTIIEDAPEGTDLHTVLKLNKISVTPLSLDLTASSSSVELKKMLGRAFNI
ncbi:5'/3'-nucleotidase SurE [Methanocella sp. CWC-04]|uniref:5'-nucleotidase SurE n=1 Tax=Methanooceanicella nereidis TaxID=2052831 RepID=A0AAP2RAN3_9EURY|nr:5'/3'-nucleotidase SurE [Methanocella sp. CWC-04]MCD1293664.1 5'/3'-nucleotidase SurE [Methanocella sp. CWC-04]